MTFYIINGLQTKYCLCLILVDSGIDNSQYGSMENAGPVPGLAAPPAGLAPPELSIDLLWGRRKHYTACVAVLGLAGQLLHYARAGQS